jgi:hypothetical protein
MRTLSILMTALTLYCVSGFAQTQTGQQNWLTNSYVNESVSVFDKDGQPFHNSDAEYSGSVFFLTEWKYGRIRMKDNSGWDHIRVRLNLQAQEVHFLNRSNVEMALPKGLIREVVLLDSAAPDSMVTYTFQTGFPDIDNQDEASFYRVLVSGGLDSGELGLVQSIRKVVALDKNAISGEEKKEVREYCDYYLVRNGRLKRMKKDKGFILSSMEDKKDTMSVYIAEKKLNFKSIDDIGQIIRHYDGLPK